MPSCQKEVWVRARFMGTARLQILASGENGERERYWSNFRFRRRKDWPWVRRALSLSERRSYIDAVLCLQKKPTIYQEVVGAKSRFDDFQIVHIDQAYDIHFNVSIPHPTAIFLKSLAYTLQGYFHCLASLVCVGIRITIDSGMWLCRRATVGFSLRSWSVESSSWRRFFQGTGIGPLTQQTSRLPLCSMAHPTASEVTAIRSILVIAASAPLIFQGLLHLCKIHRLLKVLVVAASPMDHLLTSPFPSVLLAQTLQNPSDITLTTSNTSLTAWHVTSKLWRPRKRSRRQLSRLF